MKRSTAYTLYAAVILLAVGGWWFVIDSCGDGHIEWWCWLA